MVMAPRTRAGEMTEVSARPQFEPLETREAPAVVSAWTDYRPLDFEIQGTVETTDTRPASRFGGPAIDEFRGNFKATGRMVYDEDGGRSEMVTYTATGSGTSRPTTPNPNSDGDLQLDYQASESGSLILRDSNGSWTTTNGFLRTSQRGYDQTNDSERVQLGPTGVRLQFDPSSMSISGGWVFQNGANVSTGTLSGTVTQPGAAPTDLLVRDVRLERTEEGYIARFTIGVNGALMSPPDRQSPAAVAKVQWTNAAGRVEETSARVDVAWNAGQVQAEITGLQPPEWATGLRVVVEANGWTETATRSNNIGAADLGSATRAGEPTPTSAADPFARSVVVGRVGPGTVEVFGPRGELLHTLNPYGPFWRNGVSVAVGDVNGDGVMDIITGAGAGGGPHVKVFDGTNGTEIASFYAYDAGFAGGVNVAAGDVNRDGRADIITGAGQTGAPHVKVFDARSGVVLRSFYAFDPNSRNGVSVAAGDFDNDGIAEIITGTGVGERPEVRVYGRSDTQATGFLPYNPEFRTGASVNTRRLADGRLVIVVNADMIFGMPERLFDWQGRPI